ncbi:MAG: hypothetical protein AAGU74_15210 [Bacillota bacterium]
MKTRIMALAVSALMVLALFAGCSTTTDSQNPTEIPELEATPAGTDAAITPQPTDAIAPESIPVEGVQFDESMQTFFGGDAAAAIQAMAPMLTGAASAQRELSTDFIAEGAQGADAAFEWNVIYFLLNDFGETNPAITVNDDGTLSVPAAEMEKYFGSAFSVFTAPVPEIAGSVGITYDEATKSYSVSRSDRGDIGYAVTGLTLSNASSAEDPTMSATLTIAVKDLATNTVTGSILVEVVANPDSTFGYSIQSVTVDGTAATEAPAGTAAAE